MASILLVEPDQATCDAWSEAVEAAGHEVLTAAGVVEALARVREGGIDLVVIDVYDPRAGVLELARNMEALPDAPPILLVSGAPGCPGLSARIGAARFLAKPCEPGELAGAVDDLVDRLHPTRGFDDEFTVPLRQLA